MRQFLAAAQQLLGLRAGCRSPRVADESAEGGRGPDGQRGIASVAYRNRASLSALFSAVRASLTAPSRLCSPNHDVGFGDRCYSDSDELQWPPDPINRLAVFDRIPYAIYV